MEHWPPQCRRLIHKIGNRGLVFFGHRIPLVEKMTNSARRERVAANPITKNGRGRRSGMEGTSQTGASQVVDPPQDEYYVTEEHY